jgi:hypothetical protein
MTRFRYAFSFESDTKPVHTVRGTLDANGSRQAIRQSLRAALAHWPKQTTWRSYVLVVERLDATGHAVEAPSDVDMVEA